MATFDEIKVEYKDGMSPAIRIGELITMVEGWIERWNKQGDSIARDRRRIKELQEQVDAKEKLLREIIPLIPDFNFALERNPAIANYDYLKAAIKGDDHE